MVDMRLSKDIIFISSLISLMPILLITGPAIPDIILSLSALYFLIKSFYEKLWRYYLNPISIFFFIFCIYGIFNSLFSEMPIVSLQEEGSVFYFRYMFFSLCIWYLLDKNPFFSKWFLFVCLICLSILFIDSFYQYFFKVNLFGNPKWSEDRLTSLFGDEPIVGRYLSYLSIFAFGLIYYLYEITKKIIILSIALLVITEIIVFLSGERAPFFYITFFSFLLLIYVPKFRLYRVMGFVISLSIISIIINFNPIAKERIVDSTISQMNETKVQILPYTELHERHYITGLKMFYNEPIFGIGTNLFEELCSDEKFFYKEGSCATHPHNFYIQLLAEQGFIGFIFLMFFFLYLTFTHIKQILFMYFYKQSAPIPFKDFVFIIILLVYWWPLIPQMSFYNNWNNIFLMLPLGFFLKYKYGETYK
jgi:O-antigen ligase